MSGVFFGGDSAHREKVDDHIRADQLEEGMELHLTFMGGDDYVVLSDVEHTAGMTAWEGFHPAAGPDLKDCIRGDEMVWVKKP